jgi:hypothetical protein
LDGERPRCTRPKTWPSDALSCIVPCMQPFHGFIRITSGYRKSNFWTFRQGHLAAGDSWIHRYRKMSRKRSLPWPTFICSRRLKGNALTCVGSEAWRQVRVVNAMTSPTKFIYAMRP